MNNQVKEQIGKEQAKGEAVMDMVSLGKRNVEDVLTILLSQKQWELMLC